MDFVDQLKIRKILETIKHLTVAKVDTSINKSHMEVNYRNSNHIRTLQGLTKP